MRPLLLGVVVFAGVTAFAAAQGPGGPPGAGTLQDPNKMFDLITKFKGKPYVAISEVRNPVFKDMMMQYAKEHGITNDQMNRQQFVDFHQKFQSGGIKAQGITFTAPAPGSAPAAPGSPQAAPGVNQVEQLNQFAEADFRRRDQNIDGKLNNDEMPDAARGQLERWDTDKDGLLNLEEYKAFYVARVQGRDGGPTPNPVTILIEDDLDRRPDVIRAGKLPKELPKWFLELDKDEDGQVSLNEWHKASKELAEFRDWDRNDDGLATAEEVLHKMRNQTQTASASSSSSGSLSGERPSRGDRSERGPGSGGPGGDRPRFEMRPPGGNDNNSGERPKGGFQFPFGGKGGKK